MVRPAKHFTLKVFSLTVAVVLYIFVNAGSTTPVEVEFPVEYRTRQGFTVVGEPPTRLRTTLQGAWANFRSFDLERLSPVVVDLTSEEETGTVRYRVSMKDITPPVGMKVMSFRPAEWSIEVDPLVERSVTVSPDIPGRPLFGFEISDVRIEPDSVRVSGPLRMVEQQEVVRTRAIDISDRSEDLDDFEVELRPLPAPLKLGTATVTLSVGIREEFVQRRFKGVPLEVENAGGRLASATETVTVVLKGPRRIVDKIGASTLKATVDVAKEVARGETHVSKAVEVQNLPEHAEVVAPVPRVVLGPVTEHEPD